MTREDMRGRETPAGIVGPGAVLLFWLLEKSYFDLKPA